MTRTVYKHFYKSHFLSEKGTGGRSTQSTLRKWTIYRTVMPQKSTMGRFWIANYTSFLSFSFH